MSAVLLCRRPALVLAPILALAAPVAASTRSAEPTLLWSDHPRESADTSFAQVEIRGPRVGALLTSPSLSGGAGVRVYDRATGTLLWSDEPPGDAATLVGTPARMATSAGKLFTASVQDSEDANGALYPLVVTRALRLVDGDNLWSLHTIFVGARSVTVGDLIHAGRRLFQIGSLNGRAYLVARDTRDGQPLWSQYPTNDATTLSESAEIARLAGGRLYTAGPRLPFDAAHASPLVIRQFDAATGAPGWIAVLGDEGRTRARAVDADSLAVAAGGEWRPRDTRSSRWVVHVVDAVAGVQLWRDLPYPGAGSGATALRIAGDRLYVAGSVQRRRPLPALRAYDLLTGDLLWERIGTGVREGSYATLTLQSRAGTLLVAGTGRDPGGAGDRTLLQAFDADDGRLLWSHLGADGGFTTVHARNSLLAAGGGLPGRNGTSLPLLHLYELNGRRIRGISRGTP